MFRKMYLAGESPPRLPGAGPGFAPTLSTQIVNIEGDITWELK
jgi:hypothetical protein